MPTKLETENNTTTVATTVNTRAVLPKYPILTNKNYINSYLDTRYITEDLFNKCFIQNYQKWELYPIWLFS